jgi:chromosome segregation ATPase
MLVASTKRELEKAEERVAALVKDVKNAETRATEFSREAALQGQEVISLRQQIEGLVAEKETIRRRADDLASTTSRLQNSLDNAETRLDATAREVERIRAEARSSLQQ